MGLTPAQSVQVFEFITACTSNSDSVLKNAKLANSINMGSDESRLAYARLLDSSMSMTLCDLGTTQASQYVRSAYIQDANESD